VRRTAQRTGTTVVAVVGDDASECVRRLGEGANVVPVSVEAGDAPLDRAVATWTEATSAHTPYLVHDADPLAVVVDAWVRYFDEEGPIGELEVAVAETLARWRVGSIELPDYYLVLDPERWGVTRRHWFLGVLHRAAPARVVPVPDPDAAARMLPHLGAGAWWPDLDDLLGGIERVVPDQLSAGSAGASASSA
jgi:hypothetical protein